MNIIWIIAIFVVGILAGVVLTWWYMSLQWKRNPYRFKTIVDGVIARREKEK